MSSPEAAANPPHTSTLRVLTTAVGDSIAALSWRTVALVAVAAIGPALIWRHAAELSEDGRLVLIVFLLSVAGWTLTRLGDSVIAAAAAIALVATGLASSDTMFSALGSEIVWLLLSAFMLAAVIRGTGLAEMLILRMVGRFETLPALFHATALAMTATAFVIPSTSGRAALLLPVFLVLADVIPDARRVRALALLFPTVILLSAGGSLIGAGAHLAAVEYLQRVADIEIGFVGWMAVGLPLALASSIAATQSILWLFTTSAERRDRLVARAGEAGSLDAGRIRILVIFAAVIALWSTSSLHGIAPPVVALIGVMTATLPGVSTVNWKTALKGVEWDLLLFLALTLMMGRTLQETDADEWLVAALVAKKDGVDPIVGILIVAAVATLAHLVITSRTARAIVLIPALTPAAVALGLNPVSVVLVIVLGTGFCQTLTASAKPVALFAALERPTYSATDLLRLSLWLWPVMMALLALFALVVWPAMGITLAASAAVD